MLDSITYDEEILIIILRTFWKFLRSNNYQIEGLYFDFREGYYLTFKNQKTNIDILINYGYIFDISVILNYETGFLLKKQLKKSISLTQIKNLFSNYKDLPIEMPLQTANEILNSYFEFMKNELMPIINGEMWLEELLKKKGLK